MPSWQACWRVRWDDVGRKKAVNTECFSPTPCPKYCRTQNPNPSSRLSCLQITDTEIRRVTRTLHGKGWAGPWLWSNLAISYGERLWHLNLLNQQHRRMATSWRGPGIWQPKLQETWSEELQPPLCLRLTDFHTLPHAQVKRGYCFLWIFCPAVNIMFWGPLAWINQPSFQRKLHHTLRNNKIENTRITQTAYLTYFLCLHTSPSLHLHSPSYMKLLEEWEISLHTGNSWSTFHYYHTEAR